jgi:surface protein
MRKRNYTRLLAGSLCAAVLLADLMSAGLFSSAAEATDISGTETQAEESADAQEEIFEVFSSVSETGAVIESAQMQSSEMMEKDAETEAEGFIQGETMSENAGDMETTTEHLTQAEGASENAEISETEMTETAEISESETQETETQVVLDADGNIASGVIDEDYGHITWVIDADGKLTVTGTGDFSLSSSYNQAPWYQYNSSIKSAKINVNGMTDTSYMFYGCKNMTSVDLNSFNTSKVTDMMSMFEGCSSLSSLDLSNFNTSKAIDMSRMFCDCSSLSSLDLLNFNTANVTDMNCMFASCNSLSSLNLKNFDTSRVTDMSTMFYDCSSLSSLDLSNFDTSNVINMMDIFAGCSSLSYLNINSFDTSNVTCMIGMFSNCCSLPSLNLSNFDTSRVTSMFDVFSNCSSLSSLNLSNFDTSNVTDMNYMFGDCSSLSSLDLGNFDTSNVTNMYGMFDNCTLLSNLNISNFNSSNVANMGSMFRNCSSLYSLDLGNLNTSSVTNMYDMFYNCSSISSLNLNNFDTSNVTDMGGMFMGCSSISSLNLNNFDTSNVTNMSIMFMDCSSLTSLDLSSFNLCNLDNNVPTQALLEMCSKLSTIYTPYNLNVTIPLPTTTPTDKWYRSDGTVVTELPQNLPYSVALGKNHIPKEKEPTPDIEDESIKQLVETEGSIFQFFDDMTGAPITNGQVLIEEDVSSPHYYKTDNNGCATIPLSKDCTQVFISTLFEGYKNSGGWINLNDYRSESGAYKFRIPPDTNKYKPKMPSVKASVDTSAPDVETSDGDISMLNMNMNFDLNFGKGVKSKVTYDKNDKTIKVALSTEEKLLNYDAIKHKFKSTKSKTLDEEWENALGEMQSGRTCNIDVKIAATGYLEFAENGDLMEGGITLLIKGEGTTTYRPACTGGVAYAKFKVGLSAEGKLVLTYIDGNIEHSGVAKLELYGTIAVGVGWKLAHAEVGATGKFPVKFTFPYKSSKESLSIDAILEVYGETVLLCWGGKKTTSISRNIYPGTRSAKNASFNALGPDMDSDDLEILPRNYLSSAQSDIQTYNAQKSSGLTSSDSFRYSEISADAGVFKENNVQYVRLSNGTEILAWIHDFGDKSAVNRTTLVYSVNKNDGNGWGSITPVCSDTSTGDYYPNMTAQGNKAYLVWNKASSVFTDDVSFDDVCKQMDVYVSVFDGGSFSEPQILSDADNALMEFSPLIAVNGEKIVAAWLTNSVNDYHYTKGSNSIYVCEYKDGIWGNPVCYAKDLNYVSDYDVDYIGGQAAIVYAEDADNVPDTEDGTVYYVQNSIKTMIGNASHHAEIVDICDDTIYFSGGNKVYKASGSDFSAIHDTGIETDNFSVIKSASGAEAIMFCAQDGFERNLYVSYERNGAYTSPVPIVADNSKVTNYTPLYNSDGTISIAYNEEALLTDSADIYGLTDMVIRKNIEPNIFFVNSDLIYDAYNVAPGNTLEFSTTAYNHTAQTISQVNVTLTGSHSGELFTDTQTVNIPVGEQKAIIISYTLPETILSEYYTLTVTPVGFPDIILSNNSSMCELGYSDIAIRDLKLENNTISGTITNIGYQTAKNVSLTIRENHQENNPLAVLSYVKNNLAVGENWKFSQEITPAAFEGVGDVKYYLLSAATDSPENNYGNDSATVYSEPIAATGISLDKNTLTLKEKTAAEIHAEILPENATFKNAVYVSDANDVAAVDNDGNVYALKEGSAVVTAYTLDGSQSARCEITVEGRTAEKYKLSNRGLELMLGDSRRLQVKDENGNDAENVVWSSTDETVVTITQNGTVKSVGEGIALLVAKIDGFVDVCMVRVSKHVTIVLDTEALTIALGEQRQLNATVTPSDGVVTYTSENPNIATVSETGLVTGTGIGTTVIHVASGNAAADCQVTVTERQDDNDNDSDNDDDGDGENDNDDNGDSEETGDVLPDDIPTDGEIPKGLWIATIADTEYIGENITPDAHVYDSTVRLRAGKDYTIHYKNNKNAGEATITVTGKGNYSGKETAIFNILKADLSKNDFSMEAFYVKTGKKAQFPVPILYYMGTKLKHKKDFTIQYANASGIYAQAGEYSATITGTGNYTGTRVIKLTAAAKIKKKPSVSITKATLTGFEKSFTYTGKECRQTCTLTMQTSNGKKELAEGVDYTVRYTNNIKAGTAAVIYYGKNGYAGKFKKTYKILPYDIAADSAKKLSYGKKIQCVYAKGGAKPKPVITFDGKALREGADYTLSYQNNKTIGTSSSPCVTVNGKGSFKGKIAISFTIKPQDLSKMTLVSCDKVYSGKAGVHRITPKLMDLDGKLLSAGKDYDKSSITYTYDKDTKLDNGTLKKEGAPVADTDILPADTQIRITLKHGSGNGYTGTFKGTFRIIKADIKSARIEIPTQTYTGDTITPDKKQIKVTLAGKKLRDEDYDIVLCTDNVQKGKASITLKGMGNYGGTKTVKFTIGAKGFLWWWRKNNK